VSKDAMNYDTAPLSEEQRDGIRARINTMFLFTGIMGGTFLFINFKSWPLYIPDLATLSISVILGAFLAFKQPHVLNTGRVYDETDLEEDDDETINLYINSFNRNGMISLTAIVLIILVIITGLAVKIGLWWRIKNAIDMIVFNALIGVTLQYFLCWLIHYHKAWINIR
jgi:hypothetical protein